MNASNSPNSKKTLIRGAAWTVGTRWSIKALGFLNTVIMARLLVPADYGVVAMAMLVVGLIQAILDFGAATALLRKDEVTRDEVDSAWTLRLLQGIGIGCMLFLASHFASAYFKEPKIEYVLWVMAICVGLSNASNIGLTLAQKSFNFPLDFKLQIISKLVGSVVTISTGLYFRDYRGLVAGLAAGYLSVLILSYVMHPYRPRWNTTKIGEIWAVTKWLMISGVAGFTLRKGDEIIAGGVGSTAEFGMYNVGSDLGQMPTGEIGPAMLRAFLPVLAAMKGGVDEINSAVIKTAAAVNTITLPIGFGFAAIAIPATAIILGPSWTGAAQYVAIFSIISTLQMILNPFGTLLVMRGYTKSQSYVVWIEFFAFLMSAALLVPTYSLMGLAFARVVGVMVNIVGTIYIVASKCEIAPFVVIRVISRPLVGAAAMFFLVLHTSYFFDKNVEKFIFGILIGATFYTVWTSVTWMLSGRPDGFESLILNEWKKYKNKLTQ